MRMHHTEVFCHERMELGEGVLWDPDRQRALWVNIPSGQVFEADIRGALVRTLQIPDLATTVALARGGALIVSGARTVYRVDRESGKCDPIAFLPQVHDGQRLNDGKCDSGGRLIVGAMVLDDSAPKAELFSVSDSGSVRPLLGGLRCSNGIGFSPCGRFAYHIDTPTRQIRRFAYDAETGMLSDPTIAVDTSRFDGIPDGMTVDRNGLLYVAMWGGSAVLCFDPDSAELVAHIELPCKLVTSCAFGGPALDTLLITTASQQEEQANPQAGLLYQAHVDAAGFTAHIFG